MTISRHTLRFQRTAAVAVLAAMSVTSLFAAKPMHWEELPGYLHGKYVTAIMRDGKAHRGLFVETQPGSLVLKGSTRMELPRNGVTLLRVEQPAQSNVQNAHRIIHAGYAHGFRRLFSPAAAVGLVEVPAVTAYTAVTLPFCALGDILGVNRQDGTAEDVRILP